MIVSGPTLPLNGNVGTHQSQFREGQPRPSTVSEASSTAHISAALSCPRRRRSTGGNTLTRPRPSRYRCARPSPRIYQSLCQTLGDPGTVVTNVYQRPGFFLGPSPIDRCRSACWQQRSQCHLHDAGLCCVLAARQSAHESQQPSTQPVHRDPADGTSLPATAIASCRSSAPGPGATRTRSSRPRTPSDQQRETKTTERPSLTRITITVVTFGLSIPFIGVRRKRAAGCHR